MVQAVILPSPSEPLVSTGGAMSRTWYRALHAISGQALGGTVTETGTAAIEQRTPADPAATASAAPVMMGLAATITPATTGRVNVTISGNAFQNIAGDGGVIQLRYGSGPAPRNGAGISGLAAGAAVSYTAARASQKIPFQTQAVITGLSIGTAYWLDVSLQTVTGGIATIENVNISAFEV